MLRILFDLRRYKCVSPQIRIDDPNYFLGVIRPNMAQTVQRTFDTGRIARIKRCRHHINRCTGKNILVWPVLPISERRRIPQHVADRVQRIGTWLINVTKHWRTPWVETVLVENFDPSDSAESLRNGD